MSPWICGYSLIMASKTHLSTLKMKWWLLVFGSKCKKIRSLHPNNRYKAKQKEKSTTLLGSIRENPGQTAAPKIVETGEYRELSQEQRPMSKNCLRYQNWGRKTWTVIDNCWRLSADNSELKTPRGCSHKRTPTFCEIYLKELDRIPTVYIRKISSCASGRRREKESFWKTQRTLF